MDLLVGTRGSDLAQVQTDAVVSALEAVAPGMSVATRVIESEADLMRERPIVDFGGTGAFTRTLDRAVMNGAVDMAVHSLKDVPTDRPEPYRVAAVLERGPSHDVLVSHEPLEELPEGARVGTGSFRRRAMLRHARPDLELEGIRGNVPTRISKWEEGEVDALVLARVGLARLDLEPPMHALDEGTFPPAAGQGAVAVAMRGDHEALELVERIDHEPTHIEVGFERRVLKGLGGGCLAPLGIRCQVEGGELHAWARLLHPDGTEALSESVTAPLTSWRRTADDLVGALKAAGGADLVELANRRYEAGEV